VWPPLPFEFLFPLHRTSPLSPNELLDHFPPCFSVLLFEIRCRLNLGLRWIFHLAFALLDGVLFRFYILFGFARTGSTRCFSFFAKLVFQLSSDNLPLFMVFFANADISSAGVSDDSSLPLPAVFFPSPGSWFSNSGGRIILQMRCLTACDRLSPLCFPFPTTTPPCLRRRFFCFQLFPLSP